jgi:hypothetical protein
MLAALARRRAELIVVGSSPSNLDNIARALIAWAAEPAVADVALSNPKGNNAGTTPSRPRLADETSERIVRHAGPCRPRGGARGERQPRTSP